jgi:tRNA 2-thiocytidine biosynthesis protein TtcA
VESTFKALADVRLSHLMDRERFDFTGLAADGIASPEGDRAFDPEDFPVVSAFAEDEADVRG